MVHLINVKTEKPFFSFEAHVNLNVFKLLSYSYIKYNYIKLKLLSNFKLFAVYTIVYIMEQSVCS